MMAEFDRQPVRRNNPQNQRWMVLGALVMLLGAAALPQAFRHESPQTAGGRPEDGPPLRPSPAQQLRGMTLQLHSYDPKIPFEQYVEEIARTGANTICLSVAAHQENGSSSSLFIEYRKVPSIERLIGLIKLARQRGLRVVMMPMVLLDNPRTGEWRGKIDPPEPDKWWERYENFVLFYAKIAESAGAEAFIVGSELILLEDQTQRWRGLIGKVRSVYGGKLTYSANWDHYENIQWWRDLDMVGMTVYYDLVGDKKPSLDVLLEAWKPIKVNILKWRKKIGRPILFTEVGWASQEGCAKEPWNYYASTTPDPKTQDLCFQAFFKTWAGENDVAGVLLWEWQNHPDQVGGMNDTSYIPTGKPAMRTIREFFQGPGLEPTTTRTAPATGSAPSPDTRPAAK